jgi:hypothetical protein
MATSWGTRKALGRRYSSDPALELEQQRLQQEYSLIPAREARALQATQYAQGLAETQRQSAVNYRLQKDQIAAQEKASMGGTIGNVVQAIPMTYMLGKQAGLWGTGAAGTGAAGGSTQLTATGIPQAQQGVNYGSTQYQPFTTDPALIDSASGATAAGIGAGTAIGSAIGSAANLSSTTGAALTQIAGSELALTQGGGVVNIGLGAAASGSTMGSVLSAAQIAGPIAAVGMALDGILVPWAMKKWGDNSDARHIIKVVSTVLNPVGAVIRGVSKVFKKCIIITACTSEDSQEVNIARKYRDGHMDRMELRGYYMIADRVVPKMERSKRFKRFVKWFLVDGIIDYCAYAVGDKADLPGRWSAFITKAFLSLCAYKGSRRSQYIRANGEVY